MFGKTSLPIIMTTALALAVPGSLALLNGLPTAQASESGSPDIGAYYESKLGYEKDFWSFICTHHYDTPQVMEGHEYDSSQACLESRVGPAEAIEEIATCARQVADDKREAPDWAGVATQCHIDNYQGAQSCLAGLDLDSNGSEATLEAVAQCHRASFGEGDGRDCDAHITEESPDPGWLAIVHNRIMSECLWQ